MGAERVHAHLRRLPPARWAHRRPFRETSYLSPRVDGVHPRQPARGTRTGPGDADRCAGSSRPWRGDPLSRHVDDPHDDLPGTEGACPGNGHVERGGRSRWRRGCPPRRRSHRGAVLALDPVHQHPDRDRDLHRRAGILARESRPRREEAARRDRCHARDRRLDGARVRCRPHNEHRLGLLADHRHPWAGRGPYRLVRAPRRSRGQVPARYGSRCSSDDPSGPPTW